MNEFQFLILLMYQNGNKKEWESYQFRVMFLKCYPNYTLAELEKELSYLNINGYLEALPNKYNTLKISQFGERSVIKYMNTAHYPHEERLPITNPTANKVDNIKHNRNNFKKWIGKNKDEIIKDTIVGIIAALIVAFIIWIITIIF